MGPSYPQNKDGLKFLDFNHLSFPPNLQYISITTKDITETFVLERCDCGGERKHGIKASLVSPVRQQPLAGKWTVDWTDESIFDHLLEPSTT